VVTIRLTIDGREVEVEEGTSLLLAARVAGIYVPTLCHHDDLPPAADEDACGVCAVAVEGEEDFVRACRYPARAGLVVSTDTGEVNARRREAMGRILERHPHACLACARREEISCPELGDCELERLTEHVGVPADLPGFVPGDQPVAENPIFLRDANLCVACGRCVRACGEVRGVRAIEMTEVDGEVVALPRAGTLDESGCRYCGTCVEVCPTGALRDTALVAGNRDEALVPCRAACPAGVDIPLCIGLAAEGRLSEAAGVARDRVAFPTVLGHVCYRPCEDACRRSRIGEAVAICDIERLAGESQVPTPEPADQLGTSVAIIGGGPAGLAAAYHLRLLGHEVTVFEAEDRVGGMLRHGIPELRLPRAALDRDLEILPRMGVEFRTGVRLGGSLDPRELDGDFDAVLMATGAGRGKRLDLPGDGLPGVVTALEFLRAASLGRKEPTVEGRRVAVIGGGGVAMDAASTAARQGAETVHVFCLEGPDDMPASGQELEAAILAGVNIRNRWGPDEFVGRSGRVDALELVRCERVFDKKGRFDPAFDTSQTGRIPVDVVLLAVGREPEPALAEKVAGLSLPVVWAGDAATGSSTVARAVGAGRDAALAIHTELGFDAPLPVFEPSPPPASRLDPVDGFPGLRRADLPLSGAEAAAEEADRCLRCGLRLALTAPPKPPTP